MVAPLRRARYKVQIAKLEAAEAAAAAALAAADAAKRTSKARERAVGLKERDAARLAAIREVRKESGSERSRLWRGASEEGSPPFSAHRTQRSPRFFDAVL